MSVIATSLLSSYDSVDRTVYTTASVAPHTDTLLLLSIVSRHASAVTVPTGVAGCGLTWVKITSVNSTTGMLSIWRAMGTPTTGTITITHDKQHIGCAWDLSEFSNADTSGTNGSGAIVQSVTNSGTSVGGTITLAAFSNINNATFGVFTSGNATLMTIGSGFTGLANILDSVGNPNLSFISEYRNDNDTSVDVSWTGSITWRGIAIELKNVNPDLRDIYVRKRNFTIRARLPELSSSSDTIVNADDTRIAENGDIRIARNGDIRIAHNTATVNIRIIKVRKRNFTIRGKVSHG